MTTTKLAPDQALSKIATLLSDKAGSWNSETANRVAEIVTEAGYSLKAVASVDPKKPELKCPHCGCTDPDEISIVETYRASHPVEGYDENGVFVVTNALGTTCPSEHFDDGDGDFIAYCNQCAHSDDPETFGTGDSHEWTWG